jgi:DNA invertase Pin-like site-specific DNA recombinase
VTVASRDELREVETRLAQARARRDSIMESISAEIRSLDRQAKRLRGVPIGNDKSDPVKNAGRKNVEALRKLFKRRKLLSQAEAGAKLGINSGTLVWAFRALKDEGVIEDTGRRVSNSRVWRRVDA